MGTAPHLSIHDVMPETLPAVRGLIRQCHEAGWPPPVLLVVPGRDWTPAALRQLHDWQSAGHEIAGHGWVHRIDHYGGIGHRLHAALISRQVAEHLCLDAEGILALMRRCYAWLTVQGLHGPRLYVPPAWALGRVPLSRLNEQPFPYVETLRGIVEVSTGRWQSRALLGYEAGNPFQARALRVSNAVNRARARRGAGLRIGLHPHDPELALAEDLRQDLARFCPNAPAPAKARLTRACSAASTRSSHEAAYAGSADPPWAHHGPHPRPQTPREPSGRRSRDRA